MGASEPCKSCEPWLRAMRAMTASHASHAIHASHASHESQCDSRALVRMTAMEESSVSTAVDNAFQEVDNPLVG